MATNRIICRICGQYLRWEVNVFGDHEGAGWQVKYFAIETDSVDCRTIADTPTSHISKTPEAVKSVTKFAEWLDKQLQEEEFDWDNNVPDRD